MCIRDSSSCLAVLRPAHLQAEVWRGKPSRHLRRARRARALKRLTRSLPEVAGLLLPTRQAGKCQAGECHRRHHQRLAFSAVADESRCPRSFLEVASRLRQTRQMGERRRRHHQCLAFSAVAGESRCRLSLPEAVSRLRQTLQAGECQAGECHARHRQCPAFFAVVVAVAAVAHLAVVAVVAGLAVAAVTAAAVRHPALRLPGAAGAAAQTSR